MDKYEVSYPALPSPPSLLPFLCCAPPQEDCSFILVQATPFSAVIASLLRPSSNGSVACHSLHPRCIISCPYLPTTIDQFTRKTPCHSPAKAPPSASSVSKTPTSSAKRVKSPATPPTMNVS